MLTTELLVIITGYASTGLLILALLVVLIEGLKN